MKRIGKRLFVLLAAVMLMICAAETAQAKDLVIVLDPGHGGSDNGATRTFNGVTYKESKLTQKIAEYCKAELETYEGVTVYLTRTSVSQTCQDRETRINYAKKKKADALISIHINSTAESKQTSTSGALCCVPSTSYKTATAKEARALAKSILKSLNSQVGLKNRGFYYDDELGIILFGQKSNYTKAQAKALGISKKLLNTKIPSLIVEHCYVNNPSDCKKYLKTTAKLKKLGVADATGIANYYGLKKKTETTETTETETEAETETESTKKTGVVKSGSSLYLYDKSGKILTGLVKYNGKYYYANSKGKLKLGWQTIDGKKYYFDKTTGAAKTGLQKIGKYKYYFSSKGVMKTKWVKINGKKYYFSKVNGRLLTRYWLKYNGKWYRLDRNGTPLVSCTRTIDGTTYYFNSKGVCTNKS